jgi:hypothetical protein
VSAAPAGPGQEEPSADAPRHGFSDVLQSLAEGERERVSVAAILEAFGDRAFGALLLVFGLPNALPMPPGTSAVLGAPLVFIAFQLMMGRSVLWLPRFITERSMKRADFRTLAARVTPWIKRLEKLLRPRLPALTSPVADRLTGAACLVLAVILFLPIPLNNMPPGAAIAAFALGILERDGAAVLVGWLGTFASLAVLTAFSAVIVAAFHAFATPVMNLFGA